MADIDFSRIEKKWQDKWEKAKAFEVNANAKKKKYYVLEMFPYPSGSGLHMGHALNYTIGDIYARFRRMKGANVLYPMGYDAFGLPAENAAIKAGENPRIFTEKAIANFIKQQKTLGLSYDWKRMIKTCKPEYYKWNQYFFLKFMEKGLVYRKKSAVNYCSKCETVLANEQVRDGRCWRHEDTFVEIKHLEQWFIKTTDYADELLQDIKKLQWPERIKTMQENWIGKSYGSEIDFEISNKNKVILVDAINSFVIKEKGIFREMYELLEEFPNRKIILTNANDDEREKFNLGRMPYEVFTLKHNPEKISPSYYQKMLEHFNLNPEDVIYFEHNEDAVKSAKLAGIKTFYYDKEKKDISSLRAFIDENLKEKWPIFTTRADTIYGVTFMVISAQHPRLMELVTSSQKKEVEVFLKKIKSTSGKDEDLEKEGAFTGSYTINPVNGKKIPVYTGNFVVADYGSGMVMAVPAHDQRDFEFAKKYKIPIRIVINPNDYELNPEKISRAYIADGKLVNSGEFNGWNNKEAMDEIVKMLQEKKLGRKTVNYKLRDWLVSRQRYWGTPIPVIYCDKCGIVPVPYSDLPVLLPSKVKFGSGNPLASSKEFVDAKCPKCKGKAKRETDTMDTFFDSSWYFLRYCDNMNLKEAFNKKKAEYWMPVDQYIGGAEHACMHLIYARFFTKALRDLGFLKFDEPFIKLFNQGMLHGEDGYVMSKSRGNVVIPEEVSKKYGIDSARLFLVSIASPDKDVQWDEHGIEGSYKFVNKVMDYFNSAKVGKSSPRIESKINKTIKEISEDIENFRYNMAVIKIRSLFDVFSDEKVSKKDLESFLKMLSVFCPHICEELWEKLGNKNFISLEKWPVCDEKKINKNSEKEEQALENLISDIRNILRILENKGEKKERIKIFVIPNEIEVYKNSKEKIEKIFSMKADILSIKEAAKAGKAVKAKPGKPGILME